MILGSTILLLLLFSTPQQMARGFVAPLAKHNERFQQIQSTALNRFSAHPANVDGDDVKVAPIQRRSNSVVDHDRSSSTPATTASSSSSSSITPAMTPLEVQSASSASLALTPLESWCVDNLQQKYNQALSIKCPFFRRRAADLLDATDMVIRFLIIRHKSLPLQPPGWRCEGDITPKRIGLSSQELMEVIRQDWRPDSQKGYYITGKLSKSVYRNDCLFDGPDPDMPVRGLRKYLNAASQLFDHQKSRSELLSLRMNEEKGLIVAHWRMEGVLRLPWRPSMPSWTGTTTYYTDEDGLIYRHEETWDKSVLQAFLQTLWPEVADRIWERPVAE